MRLEDEGSLGRPDVRKLVGYLVVGLLCYVLTRWLVAYVTVRALEEVTAILDAAMLNVSPPLVRGPTIQARKPSSRASPALVPDEPPPGQS